MAAGGDDDDFAQLAVEEVSDQEEPDQNDVQAAELVDSEQAPAVSQPTQKARKKVSYPSLSFPALLLVSMRSDLPLNSLFATQKKRKGNAAFQDAQAAAADVAQSNSDEQARWLWDSYKNAVGESFLEQEALTGTNLGQAAGLIWTCTRHTSQL